MWLEQLPSRWLVACAVCIGLGASGQEPLTLERATALALDRNVQVRLAQGEVAAAEAELRGASLPFRTNPELEGAAGPRLRDGAASLDAEVAISQELELSGQRGARIDAARASLAASQARLQARRVELAADVRIAFGRVLAAEALRKVAADAEELAGKSLRAAEERFAAGSANKIEVNTARVELGRAKREAARARQRQVSASAELALLMGSGAGASPLVLAGALPEKGMVLEADAALVDRALRERADLRAARAELEAARAERNVAARSAWPSPRVGVSYEQEESAHIVQGTVAFELPVFDRNQAARGVTSARTVGAEQTVEALERQIAAEVRVAAARQRAAAAGAAAYAGSMLEAMDENLRLLNEAYAAGKIDFLELLVVRRQALEERRAAIDTLEELNAAEAHLRQASGRVD